MFNKEWLSLLHLIQDPLDANDGFALKVQGDAALEGNDYADALALYTKVYSCILYFFISSAVHFTCWLSPFWPKRLNALNYETVAL
jgi:hypothetical protein